MTKKIGIIGNTGRIGQLLTRIINEGSKNDTSSNQNHQFELGLCFNRSSTSKVTLEDIFKENDYVVDFSNASLTKDIIDSANNVLLSSSNLKRLVKGLVICSSGFDKNAMQSSIDKLSSKIPLVIAPNTSTGSTIQHHLTQLLSKLLTTEYDIDIIEKHHRGKIDSPSGTALHLLDAIKNTKQETQQLEYNTHDFMNPSNIAGHNLRPDNVIGVLVQRSGNIAGEHEVSFTSGDEMISIKHIVFNRELFAKGAMKIIYWLDSTSPAPGLYGMSNVIGAI